MNTEASSYQSKTPEKCLETAKSKKKNNNKYLNACLKNRLHFTTLFSLVYGLLGVEAEATLQQIASHLVQEWKDPYSQT